MLRFKLLYAVIPLLVVGCKTKTAQEQHSTWLIDSTEEWQQAEQSSEGIQYDDGMATPTGATGVYRSVIHHFDTKQSAKSITFKQSPIWHNWNPIRPFGPPDLFDAPVLVTTGPGDYWLLGIHNSTKRNKDVKEMDFKPEEVTLEGFDSPLKTTPYPNIFDAPGGMKRNLNGYHAWQSKDMVNWVHHGPVTENFSRWVTTAEYVDGKFYIYYDYPNDQDPHLYIDEDLTDGTPGKNMGIAFEDPSNGSDCAIIRDLQGNFHVFYEDWSPINARKHSWDSPLAGHAVSKDGKGNFKILPPIIDQRTEPTGETAQHTHPHWEDPVTYDVHQPTQNAFGDWAAISIGGQYYLFADYHPANQNIRMAWFTSSDPNKPFEFCGEIGNGHPDPDITFAEGQFYLKTQLQNDYVSPGPWVDTVTARVGVDTNNDGTIDTWTDWQEVQEKYDYIKGFSKQIKRTPASLDLSSLPAGFGFCFEFKTKDTTENASQPILDSVSMTFTSDSK